MIDVPNPSPSNRGRTRPAQPWHRRSASELRLLRYAATLADEQLVWAPGSDAQRALARAERAVRTAAQCAHELDGLPL